MNFYHAEHIFKICPRVSHIICSEHNPANYKYEYSINVFKYFNRKFISIVVPAGHFFKDYEKSVPDAPEYKVPACPVPDAGQEEYNPEIYVSSVFAYTVAAKRNVHILLKPCGKRYMPSSPKFRNGF